MTPFFSVIVPVYNRSDTLAAALGSVFAQTDQDFEIIVVDDGSIDNPQAVVDAIADPRIRFLRQANRGGGHARNVGIDLARGDFVAFLDSDDIFLPRHLESMRRLLAGTEATVGYAPVLVDRGIGRTIVKPPRAIAPDEHMAVYLLCDRGFVPTITTVAPRTLAAQVRYNENLRSAEDTDFALRLYLAGCRFVMADVPGAVWKDIRDPRRASARLDGRTGDRMKRWLDELGDAIPERARKGCLGWAYAKHIAPTNSRKALSLYISALRHRVYRPKLAAIIFLQIFLSDRAYRVIADFAIRWLGMNISSAVRDKDKPVPGKLRRA
jgi:glycosyltransferase involved in cell wall biosynthesis